MQSLDPNKVQLRRIIDFAFIERVACYPIRILVTELLVDFDAAYADIRMLKSCVLVCGAVASLAVSVTVSNILPRLDIGGAIIDAHDGNVIFDAAYGRYLYYAAGYGDCEEPRGLNGCADWCDGCGCGFFYNHSVNLYSSSDLVSWTGHGNVMPLGGTRPNAVLFSPKVIFNARTSTYVLWMNFV